MFNMFIMKKEKLDEYIGDMKSQIANMLEDNGANVVGGMFLGKTFYKYNQN